MEPGEGTECPRNPPLQDNTWHVCVDAPPRLAWKFEVHSLVDLVPAVSELVCHVMSCGDAVHELRVKAVQATSARQTQVVMPSSTISKRKKQIPQKFGSHLIIVPCSQPTLVQEGYVMTGVFSRFADMGGVVFAAFCALMAGIFQVFVFTSTVQGEKGTVKVGCPFATIIFVLCALMCVILVLHRVNRHLGKITFFQADPAIILFLVVRQWLSLTYNNFVLLGTWAAWLDDAGRLAIDLIFCLCISVCDAWNVRAIIKCLFLICCLMWSGVKLLIGVSMTRWIDVNEENAAWLRVAVGESCYMSSWVAIALFISKAILSFARGGDFAFCYGELELRRGGRSRSKVWHVKHSPASCCDLHPAEMFAGEGYIQTGPQIVETVPQLANAWSLQMPCEAELATKVEMSGGMSYAEDAIDDALDDALDEALEIMPPGTTGSARFVHEGPSIVSWPSTPPLERSTF